MRVAVTCLLDSFDVVHIGMHVSWKMTVVVDGDQIELHS